MAFGITSTAALSTISLLVVACLVGCTGGTDSVEINTVPRNSASALDGKEQAVDNFTRKTVKETNVSGNLETPISLMFRRQRVSLPSGDFNPSELGGLMHQSTVVVYGQVKRVNDQTVQFDVIDILKGKLDDKDLGVPEKPADYSSCVSTELKWQVDETCVLFLVRREGGEGLQVLYNSDGKHSVPVKGMFSVDDLRRLLNGEMFTEERALELVRNFGPAGIVYESITKPHQNNRPLQEAKWQNAILHFFHNLNQRGAFTYGYVEPMIQYLSPETARADEGLIETVKRLLDELHPSLRARALTWLQRVDSE